MSDVWMGAGIIHRGEPALTEHSLLYQALLGCANTPLYAYDLGDIDELTDVVPNDGSAGSSFDGTMVGDGDPLMFRQGGDLRFYPVLGDSTQNQIYMITGDEAFANGYTNGMTWICVYQPIQEGGGSGTADGGDIIAKLFTGGPSDEQAEEMLYFGSLNYGARTKRTFSFQTANWAYNDDRTINTDLWYIFEVYFPPGDTDPVIYINGIQITGAHLTVTDSGVRVDHGAGYLVIGGDANSSPDAAAGSYAMGVFYEGDIDSTCRDNYVAVGESEGWLSPAASYEHLTVPATSSSGATSVGNFNETIMVVTGICSFFSGATTDGDTTGGSLGVGHSGSFQIFTGGVWTHIEPSGGPFTSPQPLNTYIFSWDWGGGPAIIRMGDSLWSDNSGSFEVDIYPVP